MPGYNEERRLVAVPFTYVTGVAANFIFRTTVDGTSGTAMGHVPATTSTPQGNAIITGGIIGANCPRPPRATKFFGGARGWESSYVSRAKLAELQADNWRIIPANFKVPGFSARSVPVKCGMAVGSIIIPYGWSMPDYQLAAIGAAGLTTLGIDQLDTSAPLQEQAFFGINFPKPHRVTKPLTDGTGVIKTFCATNRISNAAADGWKVSNRQSIYGSVILPVGTP